MMAKISGILPSNKRITSTDVANERPVRPGTPSFGQPIAVTANPKNEFKSIRVEDDELAIGNYGPDAKMDDPVVQQKIQKDLEAVDRVNAAFSSSLDVRA